MTINHGWCFEDYYDILWRSTLQRTVAAMIRLVSRCRLEVVILNKIDMLPADARLVTSVWKIWWFLKPEGSPQIIQYQSFLVINQQYQAFLGVLCFETHPYHHSRGSGNSRAVEMPHVYQTCSCFKQMQANKHSNNNHTQSCIFCEVSSDPMRGSLYIFP